MKDKSFEEPKLSEDVLYHYWGDTFRQEGYPEWSRYDDEQREEILELQALVDRAIQAAKVELLDKLTMFTQPLFQYDCETETFSDDPILAIPNYVIAETVSRIKEQA